MAKKSDELVLCKVGGKIIKLPLKDARAKRKSNQAEALANGVKFYDGVILCDKCGYTQRHSNRNCVGCKKEQAARAKIALTQGNPSDDAKIKELEQVIISMRSEIERKNDENEELSSALQEQKEANKQLGLQLLEILE